MGPGSRLVRGASRAAPGLGTYPPCSSSASVVLQHDHHTQFVRSSFLQQRRGTPTPARRAERRNTRARDTKTLKYGRPYFSIPHHTWTIPRQHEHALSNGGMKTSQFNRFQWCMERNVQKHATSLLVPVAGALCCARARPRGGPTGASDRAGRLSVRHGCCLGRCQRVTRRSEATKSCVM